MFERGKGERGDNGPEKQKDEGKNDSRGREEGELK